MYENTIKTLEKILEQEKDIRRYSRNIKNKKSLTVRMYKDFKIADGTQSYFKTTFPKNAIFGRYKKNIYVYVSDFSQFRNKGDITVYQCDSNKGEKFFKRTVKQDTPLWELAYEFVRTNKLWYVKTEPCLYLRRGDFGKPRDRKIPVAIMECYSQSMVEGKTYAQNYYEETWIDLPEGQATPVEYGESGKKLAAFTRFDGLLEEHPNFHRDSMEVNQIKIRPNKKNEERKTSDIKFTDMILDMEKKTIYLMREEKIVKTIPNSLEQIKYLELFDKHKDKFQIYEKSDDENIILVRL